MAKYNTNGNLVWYLGTEISERTAAEEEHNKQRLQCHRTCISGNRHRGVLWPPSKSRWWQLVVSPTHPPRHSKFSSQGFVSNSNFDLFHSECSSRCNWYYYHQEQYKWRKRGFRKVVLLSGIAWIGISGSTDLPLASIVQIAGYSEFSNLINLFWS